jgi:hypothetical protein
MIELDVVELVLEEPLEHHRVRYAGEVQLGIPVRGRRRQLTGRAVVRLVIGGGDPVPHRLQLVARKILVRSHVGADG